MGNPRSRSLWLGTAGALAVGAVLVIRGLGPRSPPAGAPATPVPASPAAARSEAPAPPSTAQLETASTSDISSAATAAPSRVAAPRVDQPTTPPPAETAGGGEPGSRPGLVPDANARFWIGTLRNDAAAANRLTAIDQLRVLGKQGDPDGQIEASLRSAMNDKDPLVAVNARDALSELQD